MESCLICHESDTEDIEMTLLKCNHSYCKKCLSEWFKSSNCKEYKCCYCFKELNFKEKILFINYFYYLKLFTVYILIFIYSIVALFLILMFFEKI